MGQGEGVQAAASRREAGREEAARKAFVADAGGGVWEVEVGEGRLVRCSRIVSLPPGEGVVVLRWAQGAAALAVGTDQGRVLWYSGESCEEAAAGRGSCHGGSVSGGLRGARDVWQLEGQALLDGAVASLWLEGEGLREGVAATKACTAWYVEVETGSKAPLVCGHGGKIQLLEVASMGEGAGVCGGGSWGEQDEEGLVASVAGDGLLRVWRLPLGGTQVRVGGCQMGVADDKICNEVHIVETACVRLDGR